jgi:hypothetical protein
LLQVVLELFLLAFAPQPAAEETEEEEPGWNEEKDPEAEE